MYTMQRLMCAGVLAAGAFSGGVIGANAQAARQAGTLVIAGQPDEAPLVRINGRSYIDVESLARLTHGTVQFQGVRTILTLPAEGSGASKPEPPQLSEGFLGAEIEALTQIREWRISLVNAVNRSYPIGDDWVGAIRRTAEAKLQMALAATKTGPDQSAAQLLRNEFANMQQMSDQLLQMHSKASYISPDIFSNNPLDAKILGCEQALASMAMTKEFQDEAQCH
ncbi:MAG TPA: hypothetical protein VG714_05310 [Acidobacteriaceae bacterium]|nr:hypothetical protein [Acidobacteriaceae bacterium]